MATLRRGLVDKVKKAAAKVGTRGVSVAAKAGTRGARALVETTVAAVKTVDKLQSKLGRGSRQSAEPKQAAPTPIARVKPPAPAPAKPRRAAPSRAAPGRVAEAAPVAMREAGRKTMPAAAAKRSKAAPAAKPPFKAKRGQKHLHSGR